MEKIGQNFLITNIFFSKSGVQYFLIFSRRFLRISVYCRLLAGFCVAFWNCSRNWNGWEPFDIVSCPYAWCMLVCLQKQSGMSQAWRSWNLKYNLKFCRRNGSCVSNVYAKKWKLFETVQQKIAVPFFCTKKILEKKGTLLCNDFMYLFKQIP